MKRIVVGVILIVAFSAQAQARNIIVDPDPKESDATWDGEDGHAYTTAILSGIAYNSLADIYGTDGTDSPIEAGDVIFLRGGTYQENYGDQYTAMPLPFSKDGTGWGEGHEIKIRSYPGEWAILDAAPSGKPCVTGRYGTGEGADGGNDERVGEYWIIERLEITGASGDDMVAGIALQAGPYKIRYCYIHDNLANVHSENPGGIRSYYLQDSIVEFNYFRNNGCHNDTCGNNLGGANAAHFVNFSDYNDWKPEGWDDREAFELSQARRGNHIRFNHFDGGEHGRTGVKGKGWQPLIRGDTLFLSNTDNCQYADRFYNNYFVNHQQGLILESDFDQAYNNILQDDPIWVSLPREGYPGEHEGLFYVGVYNNTVVGSYILYSLGYGSNVPDADLRPFCVNNIVDGFSGQVGDSAYAAIGFYPRQCGNDGACVGVSSQEEANYTWTNAIVDRNFIHNVSADIHYALPHSQPCCVDERWISTTAFDTLLSFSNYANIDDGLFLGTEGSLRFQANGDFAVSGTHTIQDGGRGGLHYCLQGTPIPAHIGAVEPGHGAWVDGLLNDVTSTAWLRSDEGRDGQDQPLWLSSSIIPQTDGSLADAGLSDAVDAAVAGENRDAQIGASDSGLSADAAADGRTKTSGCGCTTYAASNSLSWLIVMMLVLYCIRRTVIRPKAKKT